MDLFDARVCRRDMHGGVRIPRQRQFGATKIMNAPFIIAEVGSNWKRKNYSGIDLALRHISDAAACGADAVKFQLFSHTELYGIEGDETYTLPRGWVVTLAAYCEQHKIEFMCSAFSADGIKFLDRFVKRHKIASSEMLDPSIFEAAQLSQKPLIISTGGATDEEVDAIARALFAAEHTILECVAAYPANPQDYCLKAMTRWRDSFGVQVGVSDHTLGSGLALAALGAGALVFEKHFDSLRDIHAGNIDSPDASVSVGPREFGEYCSELKRAAKAVLRDPHKGRNEPERPMQARWRRRLKVTKPLKAGIDRLEFGVNFGCFRSLKDDLRAASPQGIDQFDGKRVTKDLQPQDGLWYDDIE